jgi:hypothetical protein
MLTGEIVNMKLKFFKIAIATVLSALSLSPFLLRSKASAEVDLIAPSIPQELAVKPISKFQIDLSWSASRDNVGVVGDKVFRNGKLIAHVFAHKSMTLSFDKVSLFPSVSRDTGHGGSIQIYFMQEGAPIALASEDLQGSHSVSESNAVDHVW